MRIADYVGAIKLDISDGIRKLKSLDDQALRSTKTLESGFLRASRRFDDLSRKFSIFSVASGVAFAGGATFLNSAANEASNLEESINAVQRIFGEGAESILNFGKVSADQAGLANSEFNQLSVETGALLSRTGVPLDEVANSTIALTKRAADLASVFNTDVRDSLSAINQALRGETEAIRRYAGDVTDATLQNFLFSQGSSKKVASLSQEEKTLLRLQVILQQTAKSEGDFAATSEEFANQQRRQNALYKNLQATLGREVLPLKTELGKTLVTLLKGFNSLSDEQKTNISRFLIGATAVAGLGAALAPLLFVLGKAASALAVTTVAVRVLGAALIASPIGIAISAVAALVFVFRNQLAPIINAVRMAFTEFVTEYSPHIERLGNLISGIVDKLRPVVAFVNDVLKEAFIGLFTVIEKVISAIQSISEAVPNVVNAATERFNNSLVGGAVQDTNDILFNNRFSQGFAELNRGFFDAVAERIGFVSTPPSTTTVSPNTQTTISNANTNSSSGDININVQAPITTTDNAAQTANVITSKTNAAIQLAAAQ